VFGGAVAGAAPSAFIVAGASEKGTSSTNAVGFLWGGPGGRASR
jgi:hypothetical protein